MGNLQVSKSDEKGYNNNIRMGRRVIEKKGKVGGSERGEASGVGSGAKVSRKSPGERLF